MAPTKAHFFQPLLPGFEHTFLIPVSFFRHLKGQDCERATLRGRCGKLWPVRLNGRRFEDGWLEFVQDHDLHVGDFLVFGHEGDMLFDVMVFDPTTCQKEYNLVAAEEIVVKEEQESEFEEYCKEIAVQEELASDEIDTSKFINCYLTYYARTILSIIVVFVALLSIPYRFPGESTEARELVVYMQGATGPSMQKDLSFAAILTHHVLSSSIMKVPEEFARLNNLTGRNCEIVLRDQQGRSWPAELGYKRTSRTVYIKCSWRAFCTANGIMEGDTITFDLNDKGRTLMLQMVGLMVQPEAEEHLMHCDAKTSSSSIIHPHISITVCKYSLLKAQLNIPKRFARENGLTGGCQGILLDEGGKTWPVSLNRRNTCDRVSIGKGWTSFARSKQLRVGDVFTLELVRGGKIPVMKFHGNFSTYPELDVFTAAF